MRVTLSRRDWITSAASLALLGSCRIEDRLAGFAGGNAPGTSDLVANRLGNYRFLPGIDFFSWGAVADPGFEVVRARFRAPPPFAAGWAQLVAHLASLDRPLHALCGLELRQGRRSTMPEFLEFNAAYHALVRESGLLVDERMPLARTKLALDGSEPAHTLLGFTYTVPAQTRAASRIPTFIVTGIPDVRDLGPDAQVVAHGDTTLDGLRQKAEFVLGTLTDILQRLGAEWEHVTGVQIYTTHNLQPLIEPVILPALGEAAMRGIEWHHAQLPVGDGDLEIDVRSTRMELMLD
jgi:hypothetical protein